MHQQGPAKQRKEARRTEYCSSLPMLCYMAGHKGQGHSGGAGAAARRQLSSNAAG